MNTLTWRQADHDLYVATRNGEYAGYVVADGTAHVAHDQHSRPIGAYPSLSAARDGLETSCAVAPDPAGAPVASAPGPAAAGPSRAPVAAPAPAARRAATPRPRRRRRRARAVVS